MLSSVEPLAQACCGCGSAAGTADEDEDEFQVTWTETDVAHTPSVDGDMSRGSFISTEHLSVSPGSPSTPITRVVLSDSSTHSERGNSPSYSAMLSNHDNKVNTK